MDLSEPDDVISVINQLRDSGKGVIGMKVIGGSKYKEDNERIDNAVRFEMGMPRVDMITVGFDTSDQIDDYSARMNKALTEIKEA